MNHDGCMRNEYCVAGPGADCSREPKRILAELTINPDVLPLRLNGDNLNALKVRLWDLALACNVFAAELDKGGHLNTARARFFESVAGLGPDLLVRSE